MGWKHSAVASVSRESSFYMEDPLMTDTPPGVEPKVPVAVVRETAGGGASVRGEWIGLCQICLETRSCCLLQGTVREWPENLALRRKLEMRWPSFSLIKGCPHWWHVSYSICQCKLQRVIDMYW